MGISPFDLNRLVDVTLSDLIRLDPFCWEFAIVTLLLLRTLFDPFTILEFGSMLADRSACI